MTSLDTLFQKQRTASGQSTVEVALVLPALIVLLFGIILTGFMFYAFIQVTNAAREAARAGSMYRITQGNSGLTLDQTIKTAVCDSSANTSSLGYLKPSSGCNAPSIYTVTWAWADVAGNSYYSAGDLVTATVTYSYTIPIINNAVPMFRQPMVIVRSVGMEMQ